jgi:hypothetical protein
MAITHTNLKQNDDKIYQKAKNVSTSSIARPSKIYPNRDFWFENISSGNPVPDTEPKISTQD